MLRRASVVHVVDELARAQRRERPRAEFEALLVGVAWALWGVRVELVLVLALAALQRVVAASLGDVAGVGASRSSSRRSLVIGRRGGRAAAAAGDARAAGVGAGDDRLGRRGRSVPRARACGRSRACRRAIVLRVRVRRGQSVAELDARREHLAACLRAREVRVLRDPRDAAQASVLVVRRDPFEGADPIAWPAADAERAVAVGADPGRRRRAGRAGRDRAGRAQRADRRRAGRGQVGGAVDAGRRGRARSGRADVAAGRQARRAGGVGAGRASGSPARTARRRSSCCASVRAEMEERYRELLARGLRKVRREDGLPLHLVVCDELAFYLTLPDKALRQEFAELLRDLVARGRAAGVIVVRGDAEARRRRRAVGAAGSVRVPAGAALQHAAGVGHDPRAGLGVGRRGRVDDPGRAARRRLPARRGRAADPAARLLPRRRRRAARSPSAPPRGAPTRGSRRRRRRRSSAHRDRRDGRGRVLERGARARGGPGGVGALRAPAALERLLPAAGPAARPGRRDRRGDRRGRDDPTRPSASPTGRC